MWRHFISQYIAYDMQWVELSFKSDFSFWANDLFLNLFQGMMVCNNRSSGNSPPQHPQQPQQQQQQQQPVCLYDPSVFAFRSISTAYSPLTPVEEPGCAF